MGHDLPHSLLIYAFAAKLGGPGVLDATKILAKQSGIPTSHLTLVDEHTTYAHNDPAGAYPTTSSLPISGRSWRRSVGDGGPTRRWDLSA